MATEQGCWEFNPGSTPAKDAGCTCAVLDNNHGQRPPWPPDGWWITEGCPLHDLQEAVAPPEVEQAPSGAPDLMAALQASLERAKAAREVTE